MKILSVELQTDDLTGTQQFYSEILGLDLLVATGAEIRFKVGRSELVFTKAAEAHPYYHFAFEVPNNQLDDVADWLESSVEWIRQPDGGLVADFKAWNAKSIYCYDNNHNIVEFIARFDNATDRDRAYDSSRMLWISEVGLVAPDVAALAADIHAHTGLGAFTKQAPAPEFTALGNDEVLLILSSDKRSWFPTQYPAKHFPTGLRIEHNHCRYELAYP
jgi:catechol-2,3-dioxygenase